MLSCQKIRRYFLISALSIFTILTIGYFTPRKWCHSSPNNCPIAICVANTGIHTNILVPVKNDIFDWNNYLKIDEIGNSSSNYKYLSFGWGDRAFYLTTPTLADLNLITTFKALFLPTPSAMHVEGYLAIPNVEIKCVRLNQTNYLDLIQFIKDSLQINAKGKAIQIGQGYSADSAFYEAKGNYSILRNCNSWTAEGLNKANINTPRWAGLSSAIMLHLQNSCSCQG